MKKLKKKTKKTNLKKYGTEYTLQNETIKEKSKKTNIERFGTEYPMQNKKIFQKTIDTKMKKYGKNFQVIINEKRKKTCLEKYGFEFAAQNPFFYKKMQKNSCKILKYKETDLFYQGSYEKFFLEEMEKNNLLENIKNGKRFIYILDNTEHIYYVDFLFNNLNIEIKSKWTYNKNGKDKKLELENKTKWKAVRNSGEKLTVLFNKNQIHNFVKKQNPPTKS